MLLVHRFPKMALAPSSASEFMLGLYLSAVFVVFCSFFGFSFSGVFVFFSSSVADVFSNMLSI